MEGFQSVYIDLLGRFLAEKYCVVFQIVYSHDRLLIYWKFIGRFVLNPGVTPVDIFSASLELTIQLSTVCIQLIPA